VIDQILGHSDGAVSSQYGTGVSLSVARDALCEAIFPVDIRDLWRPD
jgi:hypothetical protein